MYSSYLCILVSACIPGREMSCISNLGDHICLPIAQKCDGHDDCGNGLDEANCRE